MSLDGRMAVPSRSPNIYAPCSLRFTTGWRAHRVKAKGTTGTCKVRIRRFRSFPDRGSHHSARSASSKKKLTPPDRRADAVQPARRSQGWRTKRKAPRKGWGPKTKPRRPDRSSQGPRRARVLHKVTIGYERVGNLWNPQLGVIAGNLLASRRGRELRARCRHRSGRGFESRCWRTLRASDGCRPSRTPRIC